MEMGGVEKVLLSMLNNLDRQKFDISLSLNLYQGELRTHIPNFIPYKILAKGKEYFPKNKVLYYIYLSARHLKLILFRIFPFIVDKFILKNNADIEIATGYTMFSDVLNSSNKNSKKIGWFHSDITFPKLQPIVPKLLEQIPRFDYFIFGSQQAKNILEKTYPELKLPPNKVILNAIPIEEIKHKAIEFPINYKKKTFVSVGRLDSRKGYHKLIEAHYKLLNEGFQSQIIVIGDGAERKNLQNKIDSLGLSETFILLGTQMNPYPYIKNADFYIMPSESEGWPLIIAETLILQKPIIATNVGGVPEMIEHKKNGLLIDYDVSQMYFAMKSFLTNENIVESIKNNLKNIEQKFDNRKIFNNVEEILLDLYNKQNDYTL